MGGQAGNLPHTQWERNCYARHISGPPPALCSLFGFFWLLFSLCHSLTLSSHSLTPIPHSLTCTRAAKRRLTAADDFHDAPFFQLFMTHIHSLSLLLAQMRNPRYEGGNIFSSIFSERFANSARRLKWTSVHKVHCAHTDVVIHGYECKCLGTMWEQARNFLPHTFRGGFGK